MGNPWKLPGSRVWSSTGTSSRKIPSAISKTCARNSKIWWLLQLKHHNLAYYPYHVCCLSSRGCWFFLFSCQVCKGLPLNCSSGGFRTLAQSFLLLSRSGVQTRPVCCFYVKNVLLMFLLVRGLYMSNLCLKLFNINVMPSILSSIFEYFQIFSIFS